MKNNENELIDGTHYNDGEQRKKMIWDGLTMIFGLNLKVVSEIYQSRDNTLAKYYSELEKARARANDDNLTEAERKAAQDDVFRILDKIEKINKEYSGRGERIIYLNPVISVAAVTGAALFFR